MEQSTQTVEGRYDVHKRRRITATHKVRVAVKPREGSKTIGQTRIARSSRR